ncbi:hypothetical protein LX36DRAFT_439192 [Colletotrichum falcatum]|nr:hypothetical protein LX36DRAFT_439192 [Colletotrichum falcatum]
MINSSPGSGQRRRSVTSRSSVPQPWLARQYAGSGRPVSYRGHVVDSTLSGLTVHNQRPPHLYFVPTNPTRSPAESPPPPPARPKALSRFGRSTSIWVFCRQRYLVGRRRPPSTSTTNCPPQCSSSTDARINPREATRCVPEIRDAPR